MSRKKLIVFPTESQIKYISTMALDCEIYILVHSKENNKIMRNNNCIILSDNDFALEIIKKLGMDVDVLCCHEEGLYWLRCFGCMNWNYQFSIKIFEMLTKDKFKDCLLKHKINHANYYDRISSINTFPVVIKPIIGFGSIGVRKVNDLLELEYYLSDANKRSINLRLKPYKDRYFELLDNLFIFEEYISGCFYRTPFIVLENKIEYIFPIIGSHTTHNEYSDYHWTDFVYGKNESKVVSKLQPVIRRLLEIFDLKNGVYVAEFIISDSGEVYLLEFSPRQTSRRVSKMIELSAGIDMEKLAVDVFLSNTIVMHLCSYNSIRMRIERNSSQLDGNLYNIIESIDEKSVYGDNIKTVYYEKRSGDEE